MYLLDKFSDGQVYAIYNTKALKCRFECSINDTHSYYEIYLTPENSMCYNKKSGYRAIANKMTKDKAIDLKDHLNILDDYGIACLSKDSTDITIMDYKANDVIINKVLNMITIPKIKICIDQIVIYYNKDDYFNNLDETKIQYESEKEAEDNFNKIIYALTGGASPKHTEYITI